MRLMRCDDCGLLQLEHDTKPELMYRAGYGYRSSINETMVRHLAGLLDRVEKYVPQGGAVLDIGCNDGTLLRGWGRQRPDVERFGIDPVAEEVGGAHITRGYFKPDGRQYDVITSFAMFYDLPDPMAFAKDVAASLKPGGIWALEVGYVGALRGGLWDGVCHEHLEYYGLDDIYRIARAAGLTIQASELTSANGGSLFVTLSKKVRFLDPAQHNMLRHERDMGWSHFSETIRRSIDAIRAAVKGKRTYVLGASTKGNTLLQACGFTSSDVEACMERNPDKVGRFTPGSQIPIISEEDARRDPPEQFLVLPYHFKDGILTRETELRSRGVKFIFPLPRVEIC